jgi:hypothetical protein
VRHHRERSSVVRRGEVWRWKEKGVLGRFESQFRLPLEMLLLRTGAAYLSRGSSSGGRPRPIQWHNYSDTHVAGLGRPALGSDRPRTCMPACRRSERPRDAR